MVSSHEIRSNSRKIAVIRTDRLGDMVLTLPMCLALKRIIPGSEISMIARSYTEALINNSPALDKCFFIDKYDGALEGIFKNNYFDTIYFPRPRYQEALMAYKYKIKYRIGSRYRLYSFLFNFRIDDHRKVSEHHEAEYNVRMVKKSLGFEAKTELVAPVIDPMLRIKMEQFALENQVDMEKKIVIIHPGSGGSAKDYPPDKIAIAAKILSDRNDLNIVITGTKEESQSCSIIKAKCHNAVNLCGKLNLNELIAFLSFSNVLVANSTGVLHIAAAMGLSVVGLYPNSAHISGKRWGPFSKNSIVINPPATNKKEMDNMLLINEEDIAIAVEKLLSAEGMGLVMP
jgi:ADP-heptose:LPS heptosyltransferase